MRGTARTALTAATPFARELGSSLNALRPFARHLPSLNSSLTRLAHKATPALRDQIRPLVRAARPDIPPLRGAARLYAGATPPLTRLATGLNKVVNTAAYNPNGAESPGTANRDEGYLYWLAWLSHNGTLVFDSQDANGPYRRIYLTATCNNIENILSSTPLAPIVTGLGTLISKGVCPP